MAKKQKVETKPAPTISTQEEAEEVLAELGRLQRAVTGIELKMNERLATVKADYEKDAQPLNEEIEHQTSLLHDWAEQNRDLLLREGSKTARLATGELSWRVTPPAVKFRSAETVVENLKRLGLERFVRTREEPNKEAILAEPESVKGVAGITITQGELFIAKPFESEIERVVPVRKSA